MTSHSPSDTAATSRNVNSIRKTLAKWLRLQRPNSKNDVKKQNHGRSRYKLTGNEVQFLIGQMEFLNFVKVVSLFCTWYILQVTISSD